MCGTRLCGRVYGASTDCYASHVRSAVLSNSVWGYQGPGGAHPELSVVCYADSVWYCVMCSTERANGAMQCPVPTERRALCNVRFQCCIWHYAICGTNRAYSTTRCVVLIGILRSARHHEADKEAECEVKFELDVRNTDDHPME
eukprot:1808303-Rhodomonas_salina.1